jgi:hypothetical protein
MHFQLAKLVVVVKTFSTKEKETITTCTNNVTKQKHLGRASGSQKSIAKRSDRLQPNIARNASKRSPHGTMVFRFVQVMFPFPPHHAGLQYFCTKTVTCHKMVAPFILT